MKASDPVTSDATVPGVAKEEAQIVGNMTSGAKVVMVTSDAASEAGQATETGYRQLKVEDALAYLEQVKTQFMDSPHVYNQFLDIMKEFKAQTIDTTEVIKRVSLLFAGHRNLILGFNTFLPPGFKIELREFPGDGSVTGVSVPSGSLSSIPNNVKVQYPVGNAVATVANAAVPSANAAVYPAPAQQMKSMDNMPTLTSSVPAEYGIHTAQTNITGKTVEFDHAVLYVNKIKSRFAHNEEVYKTFLDILQTYQREPKSIKEVYKQVAKLFEHHPDLLDEFAHFLPSSTPQSEQLRDIHNRHVAQRRFEASHQDAIAQQRPPMLASQPSDFQQDEHFPQQQLQQSQQQPYHHAAQPQHQQQPVTGIPASQLNVQPSISAQSGKTVREKPSKGVAGRGNRAGRKAPSAPASNGAASTSIPGPAPSIGKPSSAVSKKIGQGTNSSVTKPSRRLGGGARSSGAKAVVRKLVKDVSVTDGKVSAPPGSELGFFEELRVHLHDSQSYSEFIKCLSLFAQDIISRDELLNLADGLLGHRKLLCDAFRALLKHSDPHSAETAIEILRGARQYEQPMDSRVKTTVATSNAPQSQPVKAGKDAVQLQQGSVVHLDNSQSANVPPRSPRVNAMYRNQRVSDVARAHGKGLEDSPSYMNLPSDYGKLSCSGMTPEDASVLNDSLVCMTGTSGYRSLLGNRKSDQPHALTRDIKQEYIRKNDASVSVLPLSYVSSRPNVEDQRVELDMLIESMSVTIKKLDRALCGDKGVPPLTANDVKPIDALYGSAFDMGDATRVSPGVVGPIVLDRMKQRESELRESRKELTKLWSTKRFTKVESLCSFPRSWLRRELLAELPLNKVAREFAGENVELRENISLHVTNKQVCAAQKELRTTLVSTEENAEIIFELLGFMIEWELTDEGDALSVMELLRDMHSLLVSGGVENAFYGDEYLYQMVRLISAVSERVGYILSHDYDGVAVQRILETITSVLEGSTSMVEWEDSCLGTYGVGRRWEDLLIDFPILLKRFALQAIKLVRRELSTKLVRIAQSYRRSAEQRGVRDCADRGKDDCDDSGCSPDAYRSAVVDALVAHDADKKAKNPLVCMRFSPTTVAAGDRRKDDELGVDIVYSVVPEPSFLKWIRLENTSTVALLERSSSLARFSRILGKYRDKERTSRYMEKPGSGRLEKKQSAAQIIWLKGLDARVHSESGKMNYVLGSEDFFYRKRRPGGKSVNGRDPTSTREAANFQEWLHARVESLGKLDIFTHPEDRNLSTAQLSVKDASVPMSVCGTTVANACD